MLIQKEDPNQEQWDTLRQFYDSLEQIRIEYKQFKAQTEDVLRFLSDTQMRIERIHLELRGDRYGGRAAHKAVRAVDWPDEGA